MSRKGWILFAVMCVVWGIPYLLIKVAVGEVSVPVVVFARTALGAVVLLPMALRSGQLSVLLRHWRPLVAFATLEMIVPWGLLSQAEQRLPSSLAGLLIAAVPIIGVVIAKATGGTERLSSWRWAGLIIGLAGVAVLAAPHVSGGSGWAVGEVLLVALGYASAPLIAARKLADVPALPMTTACLILAALIYTPAAILAWPHQMPSGRALASLAALGVGCTACAFIVFLGLIREVGTSRAMVFTYINPAVAVAAGVVLLAEPFTATIAASFGLILFGCLLATGSRRGQPAPAPAADGAAATAGRSESSKAPLSRGFGPTSRRGPTAASRRGFGPTSCRGPAAASRRGFGPTSRRGPAAASRRGPARRKRPGPAAASRPRLTARVPPAARPR